MARGGARAGAGRKATWKSGATKTVKLPEALLPQLLAYARRLDAGDESSDIVTKSNSPAKAERSAPGQGSVVIRLVDEKQDLEKRVTRLKDELEKVRRKLQKEEARTEDLRYRIADASSVLKYALKERRDGVRKSITAAAVKSALSALGTPDDADTTD